MSKFAFNTVLFKTIVNKSELTNPNTIKRKRFYNPILHYISENTEMYGSFYYEKDYWFMPEVAGFSKLKLRQSINIIIEDLDLIELSKKHKSFAKIMDFLQK